MEDGLLAMIEASLATIRLSGENQYIRLLTQPDTANLTARLAESDIVMGLQRELWYPLLEAARDRSELRADRDFDDIIRWITFLEFSLISNGEAFGYAADDECRAVLSAYLVPALRRPLIKPARSGAGRCRGSGSCSRHDDLPVADGRDGRPVPLEAQRER